MKTKQETWADQLLRTEKYVRIVDGLFQEAIKEAIRMAQTVTPDPDKIFSFDQFPQLKHRADELFKTFADDMRLVVLKGIHREWESANAVNDALCDKIIGTLNLPKEVISKYYNRNLEALETFQRRKTSGMNLSDRVWKLQQGLRGELEFALDLGLGEFKSAARLTQDVKQHLLYPDKLFRRVRDKHGILRLSKAAKAFHPGTGVYRSSFKNAFRLTRTELTMAYRDADYTRWQNLDFVVGYEIKRSHNKTECDVCEAFVGRYPKDYRFRAAHPHCRCLCISILATNDEIDALFELLMNGEESTLKSAYEVKQMPKGWKDWVTENKVKLLTAKNKPYFFRDNPSFFKQMNVG